MHDETTVEATRWRMVAELGKARDAAAETLMYAQDGLERAEHLAERAEEAIRETNREEVGEWAGSVLNDPEAVILAMGTTGLEDPIDVVEVVVLGADGETVFSERVRPTGYVVREALGEDTVEVLRGPVEVEEGAFRMHKHSDRSLRDARTFPEVYPELRGALEGKRVIVYNEEYAGHVLAQTFARYGLEPLSDAYMECVMERYSRIGGTWSLTNETYGSVALPGRDGTPTGNARALYQLLRDLAGAAVSGVSGGRRGGRGGGDLNEEDFEDIPFRHSMPVRARYPLIF